MNKKEITVGGRKFESRLAALGDLSNENEKLKALAIRLGNEKAALLAACELAIKIITHTCIYPHATLHFGDDVINELRSAIKAGEGV